MKPLYEGTSFDEPLPAATYVPQPRTSHPRLEQWNTIYQEQFWNRYVCDIALVSLQRYRRLT